MATDQKKEKERFFEDLSRLDQFIGDGDETADFSFQKSHPIQSESVRVTEGFSATPNAVLVSRSDSQTSGAQRKRKASENKLVSMPSLQTADTEPQPTRPSSSPVRDNKKQKPGRLKRLKSHLDNPDPLWRKGDPVLKPVAEDRQVFDGFVFCTSKVKFSKYHTPSDNTSDFIPNEESKLKDSIYRLRIRKSIQHGAIWARAWCREVTHIIVCDNLNWSQVPRCFHGGEVPVCLLMLPILTYT